MRRVELSLGWKSIAGYRHQLEGRQNEDAVLVSWEHPFFDAVMLVADGVGGHPEPRLAAETAARVAHDFLADERHLKAELVADPAAPVELLRAAFRHANAAVLRLGRSLPAVPQGGAKAPGSTLSAAVVLDGRLYLAHAGDGSIFLMRNGRLRPLAGGEERREGNRPQAFLGRGPRLEIEESVLELEPGDRILLCSDGLTRYFGAVTVGAGIADGAGAGGTLAEILGRPGADAQAIANQLTAHSRADQYDDDTSVVVAEVTAIRTAPDPVLRRGPADSVPAVCSSAEQEASALNPARGSLRRWWSGAGRGPAARPWIPVAAAALAALIGFSGGAWWAAGRTAPPEAAAVPGPAPEARLAVGPVAGLPRDPLVLFDPEGRRLFTLLPRLAARTPLEGELTLVGARLLRDGQMAAAGTWRLDLRQGRLTDPTGRAFFVDVDLARGTLFARHAGTLKVTSHPAGALVYLDGVKLGSAPLQRKVPAGAHRLRLVWRAGQAVEQEVSVPPRGTVSLELAP